MKYRINPNHYKKVVPIIAKQLSLSEAEVTEVFETFNAAVAEEPETLCEEQTHREICKKHKQQHSPQGGTLETKGVE